MNWLQKSIASVLACASACSSATLYRHNAPDLEATIVGGNADYLYVEAENGRVVRIVRKNVTEIDHPGNVEAIVGGILTAYGGGLAATVALSRDGGGMALPLSVAAGAVGIPGLILLADGLISWSRSTSAADDRSTQLPLRLPGPARTAPLPQADAPAPAAMDALSLPLVATLVTPER